MGMVLVFVSEGLAAVIGFVFLGLFEGFAPLILELFLVWFVLIGTDVGISLARPTRCCS
jgi:hypothetical protein